MILVPNPDDTGTKFWSYCHYYWYQVLIILVPNPNNTGTKSWSYWYQVLIILVPCPDDTGILWIIMQLLIIYINFKVTWCKSRNVTVLQFFTLKKMTGPNFGLFMGIIWIVSFLYRELIRGSHLVPLRMHAAADPMLPVSSVIQTDSVLMQVTTVHY
jgi:hypothetical protein